jgi:hypothetical protein
VAAANYQLIKRWSVRLQREAGMPGRAGRLGGAYLVYEVISVRKAHRCPGVEMEEKKSRR